MRDDAGSLERRKSNILVVDIGGSHIKLLVSGEREPRSIPSSPKLTPLSMVKGVKHAAKDWKYDVISVGVPAPVIHGHLLHDPPNLGKGWMGFDFQKAFGCPVRVVNDAVMQAIGSYRGGHMLFLGLGTGLGSAMIVDGIVEPMELAHLPYRKGKTYEDYVGTRGLERLGKKKWCRHVANVIEQLRAALDAEYVVVGGGNAERLEEKDLPRDTVLGDNRRAFLGGFRIWKKEDAVDADENEPTGNMEPKSVAVTVLHRSARCMNAVGEESTSKKA